MRYFIYYFIRNISQLPQKGIIPQKERREKSEMRKCTIRGKMATTYQEDAIERSKTFSKRNKTIANKVSYFNFFLFFF